MKKIILNRLISPERRPSGHCAWRRKRRPSTPRSGPFWRSGSDRWSRARRRRSCSDKRLSGDPFSAWWTRRPLPCPSRVRCRSPRWTVSLPCAAPGRPPSSPCPGRASMDSDSLSRILSNRPASSNHLVKRPLFWLVVQK